MAKFKQNGNKNPRSKKNKDIQVLYSEAPKIFKEKYLSPKGKRLISQHGLTKKQKEEIWKKYGKNRYIPNPNAKPIGFIIHKSRI